MTLIVRLLGHTVLEIAIDQDSGAAPPLQEKEHFLGFHGGAGLHAERSFTGEKTDDGLLKQR